jgi:hypothetical protein
MKLKPAIKGLITAAAMIAVFLFIYSLGKNADPRLQYLVYLLYGLGIWWTIYAYRKSESYKGGFGDIFNQGFRCFIIVTLMMALFYGVFNYLHPEFAVESSLAYKEQLISQKQKLPTEIDTEVSTYKKQYILKLVSGAIFGYLIIGAGVTAVISILSVRRK